MTVVDPLQNILDCMNMIVNARAGAAAAKDDLTRWICMVGEVDHMAEIHRQLKICLPISSRS